MVVLFIDKKGGREMTGIADFVPMKKADLVTYAMRSNEKLERWLNLRKMS